jgi:hypothetical protein
MSGLLESTLGAVGQAGEAIDKVTGGRALRGALAGKPRELASFVPFSDTMGLTDEKDKTSGRDLTDAYGVTSKGDTSFGSHAAGFLADNILSPANMLGGVAAFKAAPTVAKGIVGAGKALSGLDLIDHIGAGAKAIGSGAKAVAGKLSRHVEMPDGSLIHAFGTAASDDAIRQAAHPGMSLMPAEGGAMKYPVPHKPVNLDALHAETLPANASRPRRWSTDPAEKAYYSADRGRRYAERMSGREIPNPNAGPSGVPSFSLNDAFRKFAGDESGAAKFPTRAPANQFAMPDPTRHQINFAIKNLGEKFGRGGGVLPSHEAKALASSFIERPNYPHTEEGIDQASLFAETLRNGTDSASVYRGSGYEGINKHLRSLGDSSQDEIDAIRSGRYRGNSGNSNNYNKEISDLYETGELGSNSGFTPDPSKLKAFDRAYGIGIDSKWMDETPSPGAIEAAKAAFGPEYQQYLDHFLGSPDISANSYAPIAAPRDDLSEVRQSIDGLMGLFDHSRMPKDMQLYRGVGKKGMSAIEKQLGVPLSDPSAVGKEFTDPAFLSTSFNKGDADAFSALSSHYGNTPNHGVTFDFPNVPKGKTASMMNAGENEILFPPNRKIKITDNSAYPHIKAELYGALLAALMGGRAANNYQQQGQ